MDVVAEARDADELLALGAPTTDPMLAVVDIRMPPRGNAGPRCGGADPGRTTAT